MKKLTIISVGLILVVLIFASGCLSPPACGDNVCQSNETQESCPQDCGITQTHAECVSQQCVQIQGPGNNLCSSDANCQLQQFHSECVNQQCVQVIGSGENQCQSSANCASLSDVLIVASTKKDIYSIGENVLLSGTTSQEFSKIKNDKKESKANFASEIQTEIIGNAQESNFVGQIGELKEGITKETIAPQFSIPKSINSNDVVAIADSFIGSKAKDFSAEVAPIQKVASIIGSEKAFVYYQQKYMGIQVYGSSALVYLKNGKISYAKADTYNVVNVNTNPQINKEKLPETIKLNACPFLVSKLQNLSLRVNELDGGIDCSKIKFDNSNLVIFPKSDGSFALSWFVEFAPDSANKANWRMIIDAQSGKLLYAFNQMYYDNITGNISGLVYPNNPLAGSVVSPIPKGHVFMGAGNTFADLNGNYAITRSTGSLIADFNAQYAQVINVQQPNSIYSKSVPGSVENIDWSQYDESYKNEETNVFYHTNKIHDYFTSGGSFNVTAMNYPMKVIVNEASTCNAYSNGEEIHFYNAGGGCEATSLSSDILYHEYTHSVVYFVFQPDYLPYYKQSGAINEAWADYFAATINNNSLIGEDIWPGGPLRDLNNPKRYPVDYYFGSYDNGGVHLNSPIYSSALWDIRKVLGGSVTDEIVMNSIKLKPKNFVEGLQMMLVADDNDGNILNGTPNMSIICDSFVNKHGIYSPECNNYVEFYGVINSPQWNDYLLILKPIDVNVQVVGESVANWSISLNGENDIYPIASGSGIVNGNVAVLDPKSYETGVYLLEFFVNSIKVDVRVIYIDHEMKLGWPKGFTGLYVSGVNTIDLDDDGNKEIIVTAQNPFGGTEIHVLNTVGEEKEGQWPIIFESMEYQIPFVITDLYNDGNKEVILRDKGDPRNWAIMQIEAYDSKGNSLPGFPVDLNNAVVSINYAGGVSVEDIDNDEIKEIVSIDINSVYIIKAEKSGVIHQTKIPVSPSQSDVLRSNVAFGDIDGDGKKEIIGGMFDIDRLNSYINYGGIYAINDDGTIVNGFPVDTVAWGNYVSLADMDNDGKSEILSQDGKVINGNGIIISNYHDSMATCMQIPCSLTNYTNVAVVKNSLDNNLFFVYGLGQGIYVSDKNGNSLPGWPQEWIFGYPVLADYIVAEDVDDDNAPEIFATDMTNQLIWGFDWEGNLLEGFPKETLAGAYMLELVDIDRDGNVDLIGTSVSGYITVWNLGKKSNLENQDWPSIWHDSENTGRFGKKLDSNILLPSRIINNSGSLIEAQLTLKVQFDNGGQWIDEKVLDQNKQITIPAYGEYDLALEWAARGAYITNRIGVFRVYVRLEEQNSNVEKKYEFGVQ